MLTNWQLNPTAKSRLLHGAMLGGLGMIYLKVVIPVFHISLPCVFHSVTGCYCPGCGVTRAVLSLLNLDVYQAFRYNMLVFTLIPLYLVHASLTHRGEKQYSDAVMVIMVTLTLLFGVLRNFPMFSWLAPVEIS